LTNINGPPLRTSLMPTNSLKNSTSAILPNPFPIYSPLIMTIASPVDKKPSSDTRLLENRRNPSFLFSTPIISSVFPISFSSFRFPKKDPYNDFWNFKPLDEHVPRLILHVVSVPSLFTSFPYSLPPPFLFSATCSLLPTLCFRFGAFLSKASCTSAFRLCFIPPSLQIPLSIPSPSHLQFIPPSIAPS
jgi:hypothetical protein